MIDIEIFGDRSGPLSTAEKQILRDMLARLAARLDPDEPLCADMIRMARDALAHPSRTRENSDHLLN